MDLFFIGNRVDFTFGLVERWLNMQEKGNWLYKLTIGIMTIFPLTIAIVCLFTYSKYNDIKVMNLTLLF